jgi:hypothetical protein
MKVECKDLERILRDEQPDELRALELHAAECPACAEELRMWHKISAAAPALRKSWESPQLWPRIHQALAEESQRASAGGRSAGALWLRWLGEWRTALAVLVLMASAGSAYLLMRTVPPRDAGTQVAKERTERVAGVEEKKLLTDQAMREVLESEKAYIASIEKLGKLAGPKVQQAATPLMVSYREKLLVLDAAIGELRAQVEQNRFNAHLRSEMLSLYQQKQLTLQAVLREE